MSRDPPLIKPNPVAAHDVTHTFSESDVDVNHHGTKLASESVGLIDFAGTTASRPADSSYQDKTHTAGIIVNPNTTIWAVKAKISGSSDTGTSGVLKLVRDSDGAVLDSHDVSGNVAGDWVNLHGEMKSGTRYRIVADSWAREGWDSATYPYSSTDIDIVEGWNGTLTGSYAYSVSDVQAGYTATSGTVYVEWAHPGDVFAWDVGTFTRTLDSESVAVYVEESTDGGATWTEIAGPLSRGDGIPASSPEANIRYRVDLSRASTANNPTLDSLARRYKL